MLALKKFKEALKRAVERFRAPGNPAEELIEVIEAAESWDALEQKLLDLRTISRARQQEVLKRLEPLVGKIEELLEQAKRTRVKVIRNNLLRQADGYMRQLEAEDTPASIHHATCNMLTQLIEQTRRAAAMQEASVTSEAVDMLAGQLEDIVSVYADAAQATSEIARVGRDLAAVEPDSRPVEDRLAAIFVHGEDQAETVAVAGPDIGDVEARLYEN